jgi:shikimate dehydrogenase
VLGSPIAHSKSPAIHRAAYELLGLDWTYESADVTGETLADYVLSRGASWRGLSLTMPLKRDVLPLLDRRDEVVELVGAANTVLFTDDGLHGFNTDVPGVEMCFRQAGIDRLEAVQILGAGATAASVLAGVARLGAREVQIVARAPERAAALLELGAALGVTVSATAPSAARLGALTKTQENLADTPPVVVNTVPGGVELLRFGGGARAGAVLFEVAYDPWPTPLARQWGEAGGTVIPGHELLVNQAVLQIRIFLTGDPSIPLPTEHEVVSAMRAAVWED